MHFLKESWRIYLVGFVFGFNLLNVNAQVTYVQARSADTIIYFVNNSLGNKAEFTWTITGGVIVGQSSPYTAIGADSIQVIWNDSNKNLANYGSLEVSKIVNWPSGSTCPSEEEKIDIESWVQPKAIIDTSDIIICSDELIAIRVDFEGKPDYKFKWKLSDKEDPAIIIEDHTTDFINNINPSTDIIISGIANNSSEEKIYEFEITDVQDGLSDDIPGNVTFARVMIYVQPKTSAGILKSDKHLIRR